MSLITGTRAKSNICYLNAESGWLTTQKCLDNAKLFMVFKIKNDLPQSYLAELLPHEVQHETPYNLNNNRTAVVPAWYEMSKKHAKNVRSRGFHKEGLTQK